MALKVRASVAQAMLAAGNDVNGPSVNACLTHLCQSKGFTANTVRAVGSDTAIPRAVVRAASPALGSN